MCAAREKKKGARVFASAMNAKPGSEDDLVTLNLLEDQEV